MILLNGMFGISLKTIVTSSYFLVNQENKVCTYLILINKTYMKVFFQEVYLSKTADEDLNISHDMPQIKIICKLFSDLY
jgi:hypothetical protein